MYPLLFALISTLFSVSANLEGPFLFWGPKQLELYRRPALSFLDQDELMRIYSSEPAIVVFNNQDSVGLSSGYFPRLRKMLEGKSSLVLPQDFLDVHPDYVSNETTVLTLQGPWSERDAQITETFARLQDIYGEGRVLGILGNSRSQQSVAGYEEGAGWGRARREAEEVSTSSDGEPEDKTPPPRTLSKFALYNASGPPGRGALLYSSGWPVLRWPNGSETTLNNPVGEPTVKQTRLYDFVVVKFDNENSRITLEFSFKQSGGWWSAVGVEVKTGLENAGLNLQAPQPPRAPSAVLGRAYHCSQSLVYSSKDASLSLPDIQMQPYMDNTAKFSDAFDCVGFTTVPIWSGVFITFIMMLGLSLSISMILDIKTMDKFESNRSKQLTITVSD